MYMYGGACVYRMLNGYLRELMCLHDGECVCRIVNVSVGWCMCI